MAKWTDINKDRGEFRATGKIVKIEGTLNKVYESGWKGSEAIITLDMAGKIQKLKVFGGQSKRSGKYCEPILNVFVLDAEGKIMKDDKEKNIKDEVSVSKFDKSKHLTFDKRTVGILTGEKVENKDGKKVNEIKPLIDALCDWDFANELFEKRDELEGKFVAITGSTKFDVNIYKGEGKVKMELTPQKILLLNTEPEVKELLVQETVIVNVDNLPSLGENHSISMLVPVYDKSEKKKVYIASGFKINDAFLNLDAIPLDKRASLFSKQLENTASGEEFVGMRIKFIHSNGYLERGIEMMDLVEDELFGTDVQEWMSIEDEEAKNKKAEETISMYKQLNPATLKSEFVVENVLIGYTAEKGTGANAICALNRDSFTIKSMDTFISQAESNETTKAVVQDEKPEEQKISLSEGFEDSEFPFN